MARARNIKPAFFKNEQLAECCFQARLLFVGLWILADREGRLECRQKRIKAEIFPFDDADVDALLEELMRSGLILMYIIDARQLLWIPRFVSHQRPHINEAISELPAFSREFQISPDQFKNTPTNRHVDFALNEERGMRNEESVLPPISPPRGTKVREEYPKCFERFWDAYPRRVGKTLAYRKYKSAGKKLRDSGMSAQDAAAKLQSACEAFAASDTGRGEFCPHPSTWLNQGRYDDDPAAWALSPTSNGVRRRGKNVASEAGQQYAPDRELGGL